MHTLQPTLRLGRDVWDRNAMPIEEFLDRAGRLRAALGGAGLDAMLLFGSGLNGCGHPTYLANYVVKLPFSALVVLPRDGAPALMFEGATRGRTAAQATTWIDDVRPCWKMAETCLAVLAERKLTTGVIGLAGMPRLVPHAEWTTLAAGLTQATLVDAEEIVDQQRAVKSNREIAQVQRAIQIVSHALEAPSSTNESIVAAHVMREARMRGAEDIRLMVARPRQNGWTFRPPEDEEVRDGELLSVMLCASWERYWAEETRTFIASANRLHSLSNSDLDDRFRASVAGAKPGVAIAEWVRSVVGAMTPVERLALEPYGVGNGVGVTPDETPALSSDSRGILTSGMCLVIRTAAATEHGLAFRAGTFVV